MFDVLQRPSESERREEKAHQINEELLGYTDHHRRLGKLLTTIWTKVPRRLHGEMAGRADGLHEYIILE